MDGTVDTLKKGATYRGVGDNWDLKILKDHVRKSIQNEDLHLFSSTLIKNRIDFTHLPNDKPIGKISELQYSKIVPNKEEWGYFAYTCKILILRILIEFFPEFKIFDGIYPEHISHQFSHLTKNKSTTATLPIIDADEKRYQDCVTILRTYEKWIWELYQKAGLTTEEISNIQTEGTLADGMHADPGQPCAQVVFTEDYPMTLLPNYPMTF